MRKVVALACGVMMALSAPAFAQTAGTYPPNASQPAGGSLVSYQNGLEALGQAPPPGQGDDQNAGQVDPSTGLIIGGVVVGGGILAGVLLSQRNQSKSVSP